MNISVNDVSCFGFTMPTQDSWLTVFTRAAAAGTLNLPESKLKYLETSFNENIKASYSRLVSFTCKDLDTDIDYACYFDNSKKNWILENPGSSKDSISDDDYVNFFKSEEVKKLVTRAVGYLKDASKLCKTIVDSELKRGKLISIDTIKLEAIVHMLDDQTLMSNFKQMKY